MNILRNSVG